MADTETKPQEVPNGAQVIGVVPEPDFRRVIEEFGVREKIEMLDKALLKLAMLGAECVRMHRDKDAR